MEKRLEAFNRNFCICRWLVANSRWLVARIYGVSSRPFVLTEQRISGVCRFQSIIHLIMNMYIYISMVQCMQWALIVNGQNQNQTLDSNKYEISKIYIS